MDHELDVVGELKPDDLQQIPGVIRSDRKDPGRVGVGIDIDDRERMVEGVEDGGIRDAVPPRRSMDLHIRNIVIRNSEEWNQFACLSAVRDGCPLLLCSSSQTCCLIWATLSRLDFSAARATV